MVPVKGISHLTFIVRDLDRMATLLVKGLGAEEVYDSESHNYSLSRERFFLLGGVWLAVMEGEPPNERSYQHVAFAVENRAAQLEVRKALMETGYQVTPVIDRDYFWAIYFRTPGDVLFEVATNEPGFDRDEDSAHLGEALRIPAQHAHLRAQIERVLTPIAD